MIQIIRDWLRRRHQRRVLRRLAKLEAKIEAATARLQELHDIHNRMSSITNFQIDQLSGVAAEIACLKRIRAHNFQHEDVL